MLMNQKPAVTITYQIQDIKTLRLVVQALDGRYLLTLDIQVILQSYPVSFGAVWNPQTSDPHEVGPDVLGKLKQSK